MGPALQNHPITQFRGITTTVAAIACWAFSTIALAQSGNRGNFFVSVPDRNATIVVADGSNTNLVCADVEFIDSLTGQVRRGTGTLTSGCVGKLTSGVSPSCQTAGQKDCFITANGRFVAEDNDSTALTITGVSLGLPTGAGTSGANVTLEFLVSTSATVRVTGSPKLPFKIGSGNKFANYLSGNNTSSLRFSYLTQSGDNGDVKTTTASSLELNGGTLRGGSGNDLNLGFTGSETSRKVDTTVPLINEVRLTAPSGLGASGANTALEFTVTTSEPITVTGIPTMGIKIGDGSRTATYHGGSGTESLVFRYTTVSGDTGLISTPAGSTLALVNNATMGDAAANTLALAFTPITTERTIDTTVPNAPTISSPANSGYFNAQISATINQANTVLDTNFKDLRYTLNGVDPTCVSSDSIASQTGNVVIQTGANRTLKVIACDFAGNASSIATQVFTYDNTPPDVPTLSASATSFSTTPFNVTANKNNTTDPTFFKIRYNMGTNAEPPSDCSSGTDINSGGTIPIANLITTRIAAIACDYAGNKSAPITATYTYGSSPSNSSPTGTPQMTSQSPERKSFYDTSSQKYWNFFYSGSDVEYGYTSDGITFVSGGKLNDVKTPRFAVASQSGVALIAYEDDGNIMVRRGSINETTADSGTWQIDWENPVAALTGTVAMPYRNPAITIGKDNYVWVAGWGDDNGNGSVNYSPKIVSSTVLSTISSLAFGNTPDSIATIESAAPGDPNLALVPYGNNVMLLTTGSDRLIRSYVKESGVWAAKSGPNSGEEKALKFSVSSDSAGVQLAYVSLPEQRPYYATFSENSWNPPAELDDHTVDGAITLSTASDGSERLVAWSTAGGIKYMKYSATEWSDVVIVESAPADNFFPVSPMEIGTSTVPLYWTKGSSTYDVTSLGITIP